jgi:hypothetical protein
MELAPCATDENISGKAGLFVVHEVPKRLLRTEYDVLMWRGGRFVHFSTNYLIL